MDQADDLKAFERRMVEIISSLQSYTWRWRVTLGILLVLTLITFYALITNISFSSSLSTSSKSTASAAKDLNTNQSYFSILSANLFRKEISFSISFGLLIFAFLCGIHRKIFTSSIVISRFRYILADYNMSCDANGRLIIKPRYFDNLFF